MAESIVEINCAESVTIAQVADLYAQLLMAMAEGQAIQINLSDIDYHFHESNRKTRFK